MILVRIWIGFMIIGALFSTYYDLKYEFGLLQVGKYFPFRSKTYFNKTEYAYGMFLSALYVNVNFCSNKKKKGLNL